MEGCLCGNLYKVNSVIAPPTSCHNVTFTAHSSPNLNLWHARFGHIGVKSLHCLDCHNLVTGMNLQGNGDLSPCNGCAKGKHHHAPFPHTASNRAEKTIERLHMDLQGPFDASIQGYIYTICIVDDYSRKGWQEFLRHKDDAATFIKTLIQRLETFTGRRVKSIRSDRGGKFIGEKLKPYLREKGITHKLTAPYTPQQSGVAEQFNQTTHKSALTMLTDAELSKGFWPEAHEYANYGRISAHLFYREKN